MTNYLLDGNILTVLEDPAKPFFDSVHGRLAKLTDDDNVFFSIMSAYEFHHGMAKASPDLRESLEKSWDTF